MTTEELYEVFGDIDERCVKEARKYRTPKKRFWRIWGVIAACLCLLFVGVVVSIRLLGGPSTLPNDIREPLITPPQNDSSEFDEKDVLTNLLDNASKAGNASSEDGTTQSDETKQLVINTVNHTVPLDFDVQITSFSEQFADRWASTIENFRKFTGITYEDFTGKIPDNFEQYAFYSASTRGYKETGSLGEYILHDYVFNYQSQSRGSVKIAICSFEAPLRDCLIVCDNPEKSVINGVSIEIYGYQDTFIAQFSYNGINYDIETSDMTQDGLVELLICIIG